MLISAKHTNTKTYIHNTQGYAVEAAMGASSSSSSSCGGAGGGSSSSQSFSSSSEATSSHHHHHHHNAPLFCAVFIDFGGTIVWDKENPDVWETYLVKVTAIGEGVAGAGAAMPQQSPELKARQSSSGLSVGTADSTDR